MRCPLYRTLHNAAALTSPVSSSNRWPGKNIRTRRLIGQPRSLVYVFLAQSGDTADVSHTCSQSINLGICRRFLGDLTQFLHNSEPHLFAYALMALGTCREH